MRLRLSSLLCVLVGAGALAASLVALMPGPVLEGPARVVLPVGVPSEITFHIANRSLSRLAVVDTTTSCGCLRFGSVPENLGAWRRAPLSLAAQPLVSQWGEPQMFQVSLASGDASLKVLSRAVIIDPIPIWDGFPSPIAPLAEPDGTLVFRLDPRYADVVGAVELHYPGGGSISAAWDSEAAEASVQGALPTPDARLVLFSGETGMPIWGTSIASAD